MSITLKDKKDIKLLTNGDINKNTYFRVTSNSSSLIYYIEFNAIIKDSFGELINGKKCKL